MLKTIELTGKEVIYLASILGAESFTGVANGFEGMTEEEILLDIMNIQTDLTAKEYIKMEFESDIAVNEDIESIMDKCIDWEKFIVYGKNMAMDVETGCAYYIAEDVVIRMEQCGEMFSFKEISKGALCEEIMRDFEWDSAGGSGEYHLNQWTLEEVRDAQSEEAAIKKLVSVGMSEKIAKIVKASFDGNVELFFFDAVDELGEQYYSVNGCYSEEATLVFSEVEVDYEEKIQIAQVDPQIIATQIQEILKHMNLWEEESFV